MNTSELIREIFRRLWKYRILILSAGIITALLLFFYAKNKRVVYTAKTTIFPLTNNQDNTLSTNALSGILGLNDAPKSFSNEATINIIELALSRFVRESVAATRLPEFDNQTITQLLIRDYNSHKPFLDNEITLSSDSIALAITGAEILKPGIIAKMSKNGLLELYFSHPNKNFITPFSYVLIDKISKFYIDLKIKKATADYNFTVKKIDSLDAILNRIDDKAIHIQNTTLFAPPDKLEYDIPKQRVVADKQRYMRQRDISLNNQEEALWRLQKLTPIISVLDKPTEPFTENKTSTLMYLVIGFIAGCIIAALTTVSQLLYKYVKGEIYKSLFGTGIPSSAKS